MNALIATLKTIANNAINNELDQLLQQATLLELDALLVLADLIPMAK